MLSAVATWLGKLFSPECTVGQRSPVSSSSLDRLGLVRFQLSLYKGLTDFLAALKHVSHEFVSFPLTQEEMCRIEEEQSFEELKILRELVHDRFHKQDELAEVRCAH